MKRIAFAFLIIMTAAVILLAVVPSVFAQENADMNIKFDFLDEATYGSYLVYNNGMLSAGNSTQMGYKGWIGSKSKYGTSVFKISSESGIAFGEVLFEYRAYCIGPAGTDMYNVYFSAGGDALQSSGYDESKWTLVSAVVNDPELAGGGVYVPDPTNRDSSLVRRVDLTSLADGLGTFYIRIDSYRSGNIDGVPACYGGMYEITANYKGSSAPSLFGKDTTAPDVDTSAPDSETETSSGTDNESTPAESETAPTISDSTPETTMPAQTGGCAGGCVGNRGNAETTTDNVTVDTPAESTTDDTTVTTDETTPADDLPVVPVTVSADDIPVINCGSSKSVYDCGDGHYMRYASNVLENEFTAYVSEVNAAGFVLKNSYSLGKVSFREFEKDGKCLKIYHSKTDASLRAIIYPAAQSRVENSTDRSHDLLFTQVGSNFTVKINAMCYIIRTEAGSFIVIDGGWGSQGEAKRILDILEEQNENGGKPVVAAWIITHPHSDHIGAIADFSQLYDDRIILQRLIYNFVNDEILLASDAKALLDSGGYMSVLRKSLSSSRKDWHSAEIIKPHTGDLLDIDGVKMQILHTHEDTYPSALTGMNAASLVFRLELGSTGKSAFILGDLSSQGLTSDTYARYGDLLRSDILQPVHHGTTGGRIDLYSAIAPSICMWPTTETRMKEYADATDSAGLKYNAWLQKNVPTHYIAGNGTTVLNLSKE